LLLPGANTLAYYENSQVTDEKSLTLSPERRLDDILDYKSFHYISSNINGRKGEPERRQDDVLRLFHFADFVENVERKIVDRFDQLVHAKNGACQQWFQRCLQ
jgi:hypothetical protein